MYVIKALIKFLVPHKNKNYKGILWGVMLIYNLTCRNQH